MLRIDLEGDLKAAMTRALLWRRTKLDLKTTYNGGHVRTMGRWGGHRRKRERERGVWMEKETKFREE